MIEKKRLVQVSLALLLFLAYFLSFFLCVSLPLSTMHNAPLAAKWKPTSQDKKSRSHLSFTHIKPPDKGYVVHKSFIPLRCHIKMNPCLPPPPKKK